MVLELSGLGARTGLAAIVPGEPATTLYAEMYPEGMRGPNMEVSRNLEKYYTDENRRILEGKVKTLSTPILIVHSDRHHVNILNNLHLVPAIRAAGKDLETIIQSQGGFGGVLLIAQGAQGCQGNFCEVTGIFTQKQQTQFGA